MFGQGKIYISSQWESEPSAAASFLLVFLSRKNLSMRARGSEKSKWTQASSENS